MVLDEREEGADQIGRQERGQREEKERERTYFDKP
jgi:hypothetical protein